ncbi:glycosyltransferase family 4 protein [candidate division KSB1 bacterium]
MNKLKILLLTSSYPREKGYTRNGVMYIAEELVRKGMEVGVLVTSLTKDFKEYTRNGVTVYEHPYTRFFSPSLHKTMDLMVAVKSGFLPKIQLFGYFRNSVKYIRKIGRDYDLIHAFWFVPSGFFLAVANKFSRKPSLLTSFGSDLHSMPGNFLVTWILRFVGRNFNFISAISRYLVNKAQLRGIDPDKIHVIPALSRINDFNLPRVRGDKIIIATAARLIPLKRVKDLITAASIIEKEGITSDYEVWIIGEGPEMDNLTGLTKSLNLEDRVKFPGYLDLKEWPEKLSEIDIFVHCSEREGLSTVNIEAMAAGCVVITTDGHSNEELIDDGVDGIIYKNSDPEDLKDKLVKVIMNPQLKESISIKAREKSKRYDVDVVVDQYLKLYGEILEKKSSG